MEAARLQYFPHRKKQPAFRTESEAFRKRLQSLKELKWQRSYIRTCLLYTSGMRQRLAIAQAIMEEPDILILDEPMNGLDKKGVQEMRELFLRMRKEGKLIILASHNREDIDVLCDEVYEMENGKLNPLM